MHLRSNVTFFNKGGVKKKVLAPPPLAGWAVAIQPHFNFLPCQLSPPPFWCLPVFLSA